MSAPIRTLNVYSKDMDGLVPDKHLDSTFRSRIYACLRQCVSPSPLSDLVLSPQNKFRPHVLSKNEFKNWESTLQSFPPCPPSPLPAAPPYFPASNRISRTTSPHACVTLDIFSRLFSHLSDLMSHSGTLIPPQLEERFSAA